MKTIAAVSIFLFSFAGAASAADLPTAKSAPLAPTPVNIALGSRILATLTGGAGGLAAHYLYTEFAD